MPRSTAGADARVGERLQDARELLGLGLRQLTDTLQETNGLLRADREPKIPIEQLRTIICG